MKHFDNSLEHATLIGESCSLTQKLITVNRNTASCVSRNFQNLTAFPIPHTYLTSWNSEQIPQHFHPPWSKVSSMYHLSHSANHLVRNVSNRGWLYIGHHNGNLLK